MKVKLEEMKRVVSAFQNLGSKEQKIKLDVEKSNRNWVKTRIKGKTWDKIT